MIQFGTGGWREIIGDKFTKVNVQKIAMAIVEIIEESNYKKEVCVGYDRRFLSKEAAIWVSEVLIEQGIFVHFVNKSQPTPLIMYATMELGLDISVCITASHNPALYNGIKVFTHGGRDANEIMTARIQERANQVEEVSCGVEFYEAMDQGRVQYLDYFNQYIDGIMDKLDQQAIKDARLKVVLDPMYGVSQTSLRTILSTVRCDLTVINDRHDTLFGGKLPTPNSEGLEKLKWFVTENKADIGIATDGDADRIGVIDDLGNFLHPNEILVLLYYYLVKVKGMKGDVVRNNSTTHMLDKIATAFGYTCHEVNVGFKHVSSKMQESGAIIGGESSGGLTVVGHINGKDGIYAASILIEMIALMKMPISKILEEVRATFGSLHYVDTDMQMTPAKKELIQREIMISHAIASYPDEIDHISYQDGCKIWMKDGSWIIVRFSGTEPLLRMAAEASTLEHANELIDCTKKFVQSYL